MRAFYTILFISSCLFFGCLKTAEFEIIRENQIDVALANPIRFDQLAVGQKSTYVLIRPDSSGIPSSCQQTLDTLRVEIIEQNTNGYLVKETTTLRNSTSFFFYLKYEMRKVLRDTIENEPSIEEYDELLAIKTEAIDEAPNNQWSALYNRMGARLYLNALPHKSLIPIEIGNLCEVFFLPEMEDDPLPDRDNANHSELGITQDHIYDNNCFEDLLISNHNYGYEVDAFNFTYGYSLEAGLVFSGEFRGIYLHGNPAVWHIIPDD